MPKYICQRNNRTNFIRQDHKIQVIPGKVRHLQGKLSGQMSALGFSLMEETMKRVFFVIVGFLSINSAFGQADFLVQLADSALTLTKQRVLYDPSYIQIAYPNGDVPANKGVCTDVVIRAYRKLGIDLQKEVHEDMKANFDKYPKKWGLSRPDRNIDHRRVLNLMKFFSRQGTTKEISQDPKKYQPGDIVCWDLGGGITHIGIVAGKKTADNKRHLIIHNIGAGQVLEDCLFNFKIIGHYTYGK